MPKLYPWAWVYCTDYLCGHARAIPFGPWAIRWGMEGLTDRIRRDFVCSQCSRRGAVFSGPHIDNDGLAEQFPVAHFIRIGGPRRKGEGSNEADRRNRAEYLARYSSGDALGEFYGGPPGPAQMCGKFTAMASWSEVVAFSKPLTREEVKESDNDRIITFRVMDNLPVITWDKSTQQRRVVSMRWGWPAQKNWKIPKHIHVRGETIDTTPTFSPAFKSGQRGIVIVRTFNEAPDIPGPTIQHTITPGEVGALGIALLWGQFDLASLPGTLRACVMVTVPANQLIATLPTDRMPAILADEDWDIWLRGTPDEAKARLKTVEGVRWTMTKEEKAAKAQPRPPTMSDPTGLF